MTKHWQNRIQEYGVKPADQFTANPANPRIHPQFQREVMKAALDTLGWLAPVIENKRTGYLVDGHERVMQALLNNEPVPYVVVDLSEAEEATALATFDPITALANYDNAALDALLRDVQTDSPALDKMLAELAVREGVCEPDDPRAEWVGMPEFEQENQLGLKQIIVHFESEEDVQSFANLVQQPITMKTKYIWYPQQDKLNAKAYQVTDES